MSKVKKKISQSSKGKERERYCQNCKEYKRPMCALGSFYTARKECCQAHSFAKN